MQVYHLRASLWVLWVRNGESSQMAEAIRALRDAGLRVPEDVSVMGFDGLAVGEYTVPTLSTIRQSVDAMAQRSVDILLENIGHSQPARYETVPFFVELRESTKKN